MSVPMNESVGPSYPLVGIGRVCFADDAGRIPNVLMDDGFALPEEHDYILGTIRRYHPEWEITTDGVWEHMPQLDHTGQKHHYLNITVNRKERHK